LKVPLVLAIRDGWTKKEGVQGVLKMHNNHAAGAQKVFLILIFLYGSDAEVKGQRENGPPK
jgi:hypothetical protein